MIARKSKIYFLFFSRSDGGGENDDGFLARVQKTPQGQEVAITFFDTLLTTEKIEQSFDRAREVAERNGKLKIIGFSVLVDFPNFLVRYGPQIIQLFQIWMSKMDKK
jgi:hypothetical protein